MLYRPGGPQTSTLVQNCVISFRLTTALSHRTLSHTTKTNNIILPFVINDNLDGNFHSSSFILDWADVDAIFKSRAIYRLLK